MGANGLTRRQVLRGGGGLLAVGAVASSAGCLGSGPLSGGANYRNWLHEPGELGGDDDHYRFRLVRPGPILERASHLPRSYVDRTADVGPVGAVTGVEAEDVSDALIWQGFGLYNATFDRAALTDELRASGFVEDDRHESYALYVDGNPDSEHYGWGVAVTGGTFLVTLGGNPRAAVTRLETAIDTRRGDVDRYAEEVEGMAILTDELGRAHVVIGETIPQTGNAAPGARRFSGQVALGSSRQITGERTQLRQVFVFADSDAARDADVDAWLADPGAVSAVWRAADDVTTDRSGKAVVVDGTVPSEALGR